MSRDYIETGVEWINSIPNNWKLLKVKNCFYISKKKAQAKNPTILKLARDAVKVRDISTNEGQIAASYDDYNPVFPGDFLLNPMDLYSGANCNVSEVEGVISPAYINLRKTRELNPKYFDYYFKVQYWTMAMFAHGKGVSFDNRWTINAEGMKNYEIPFPNIDEQNKIVAVINEKCSQIDELIAIQEQEIEKLKAYKQSLISEVVTKGLDPNVEMKDSGVEWIGITPKHWEVKQLRYIANDFQKGSGITKEDIINDGDISCVRYADLYTDYSYNFKDCKIKTNLALHTSPKYFSYGDLLFTCTGELVEEIGKSATYLGHKKCLAGGDIIICKHSQNPTFMGYALGSLYCQMQKSYGKRKLKVVHISLSEIKNIFVTLPSLEEQNQIGEFLNQKCLHINELIELKNNKIDQLHNYKKSLIYEYVTGKKEAM